MAGQVMIFIVASEKFPPQWNNMDLFFPKTLMNCMPNYNVYGFLSICGYRMIWLALQLSQPNSTSTKVESDKVISWTTTTPPQSIF